MTDEICSREDAAVSDKVAVSIVICTIERSGRDDRLAQVIRNLQKQEKVDLEIILVWQGFDPELFPRIEGVTTVITNLFSSSEARNTGAEYTRHDFLAFYDDDVFPVESDQIYQTVNLLNIRGIDFITNNIKSEGVVTAGGRISEDVVFTSKNLLNNMWEPGLLVRREAFFATRFDSTLGIGCVHGSSEGLDFGCRLLKAGYKGQRIASLYIDHPPLDGDVHANIERNFFYSLGNGAVLLQHGYRYAYGQAIVRSFVRLLLSLISGKKNSAAAAFVRILCLLAGPFIPRRPARLLPRNHIKSPTYAFF